MSRNKLLTAAQLGVTDVLETVRTVYALNVDVRGQEAYFLCPVHDDHKASASVNLKTGWWNCWTCSAGGDIIGLGSKTLNMSRMLVQLNLSPSDPDAKRIAVIRTYEALKRRESVQKEEQEFVDRVHDPSEFQDEPMDYMFRRGFKLSTLNRFGIRYVREAYVRTKSNKTMRLRHSIAIPLHSPDGSEIVGWCFRATSKSGRYQPRYFYTTGSKVSEILFAEHMCRNNTYLVVTEGAIDSMWIWQAGYQAVAVLGASNATPLKADRISDFKNVVIFGDRNRAGIQFADRLGNLLRPHTSVSIARYRRSWTGNDPNELNVQQVSDAIERAIPFHQWRTQAG